MLANCSTFQTWVGAANATAAKSSIYYDAVPRSDYMADTDPLSWNVSIRPFAIVWTENENGFSMTESSSDYYTPSGTIKVRLEQNTPSSSATDWEEADRLFKNTLGDIIRSGDSDNPGLLELSIARTYAQISRVTLDALYRTDDDEYDTFGDAQAAEFSISWGVGR